MPFFVVEKKEKSFHVGETLSNGATFTQARVVIYLNSIDQQLTFCFKGSNLASVFIYAAYYNNNWVISL